MPSCPHDGHSVTAGLFKSSSSLSETACSLGGSVWPASMARWCLRPEGWVDELECDASWLSTMIGDSVASYIAVSAHPRVSPVLPPRLPARPHSKATGRRGVRHNEMSHTLFRGGQRMTVGALSLCGPASSATPKGPRQPNAQEAQRPWHFTHIIRVRLSRRLLTGNLRDSSPQPTE